MHDRAGNVIAETDASGATVREYIWLPGAGHAGTDLPLAVIDNVNTLTPQLYHVHADHLGRPVRMTDAARATVWQATWTPWGAPYQITGALALDARFPGQWYQLDAGLHYNWHRHYDASLGRYTQPDPLGFVDGPSLYGYAKSHPIQFVDPDGRIVGLIPIGIGATLGAAADIGIQLLRNGGNWRCIRWGQVAAAAAAGAVLSGFGPSGFLLGRGGVLNAGYKRFGWSQHKGRVVLSRRIGKQHFDWPISLPRQPNPIRDGAAAGILGEGTIGGSSSCECE